MRLSDMIPLEQVIERLCRDPAFRCEWEKIHPPEDTPHPHACTPPAPSPTPARG